MLTILLQRADMALKGMNVLLMQYDAQFRNHQKLENSVLNQRTSAAYHGFQELETKQLLFDLKKNCGGAGTNCHQYFERTTASIIFALFYAFRLKDAHDPSLLAAISLTEDFSEFVRVGAHPVDSFPILNLLPAFLAPWKGQTEAHWKRQRALHLGNLKRGLDAEGWTFTKQMHQIIQNEGINMPDDELALEFGTMVDAALDGTTESLSWFVIACIKQDRGFVAKARKAIDDVVGRDRLPDFGDQAQLPYITAIVEEVMRWRPVGAGGVPHFTKTESEYEGYRIPAGTTVIANHWAITREEAVFGPNAESFVPERWLEEGSTELKSLPAVGFGYGRRTCPGRHFARDILWIEVARLLWAFEIEAGKTETGEPIEVDDLTATDGLVMRPMPYKASFKPRDSQAEEIIARDCDTHDEDLTSILSQIGREVARK